MHLGRCFQVGLFVHLDYSKTELVCIKAFGYPADPTCQLNILCVPDNSPDHIGDARAFLPA